MLAGDDRHLFDRFFDTLGVATSFAKSHVEDNLDKLRAFHDGRVAELFHEFRDDLFLILRLKTGDEFGFLIAFRVSFFDGHAVFLFFSHVTSPYLMIAPLFFATRTFLPSTNL